MTKIDRRLFDIISCLSYDRKVWCFVYFKEKEPLKKKLFEMKIPISSEYLCINALFIHATREEILALSKLNFVQYISSTTLACCQMKVAKEILKTNAFPYTGAGVNVAFIDTGICSHCDFMIGVNRIKLFKDFFFSK